MLSVVIPTLDAGAHLGACLDALVSVPRRKPGPSSERPSGPRLSPGNDRELEVVVVDGGSSDDSAAIAEAAGARLIFAPRGRGTQLRAGGAAARGDWLLFLHSDTHLGPGWRDAVAAHVGSERDGAACFRFRLDDPAWQARIVERGVAARVALFGLPYGDQGLLVSRALYDRAGGYRPLALMEDVDLVRRLGRVRVLDADAVTSAARWRRDGWFRRSARNALCMGLYRAGVPAENIHAFYHRMD